MKSQQDIERHDFEQFRKAAGLEGIVDYGNKPDVILHLGSRKIGVEITNLYLRPGDDKASEQRQRRQRQNVIAAAHERYRKAGGRGLELTITFDPKRPIRSERKDALVGELVDLARRIEDRPTGNVSSLLFEQSRELEKVWLNANEHLDAVWTDCPVYDYNILSVERLSERIREKEAKVSGYQSCDTYWLLGVVDLADPAQDQEIAGTFAFASNVFERIILYKPGFNEIIHITPTASCSR